MSININSSVIISATQCLCCLNNTAFCGTGYFRVPIGTCAQRPSHSAGLLRFNTQDCRFEMSINNTWVYVSTSS